MPGAIPELGTMNVILEKIPIVPVGNTMIIHWAIHVGSGGDSRCYEFEGPGALTGPCSNFKAKFGKAETQYLGVTQKTHKQILSWLRVYDQDHFYWLLGEDAGSRFRGKNCQDFAVDLCTFLGVDTNQLPQRQAVKAKADAKKHIAVVAAAMGLGVPGASLLSDLRTQASGRMTTRAPSNASASLLAVLTKRKQKPKSAKRKSKALVSLKSRA